MTWRAARQLASTVNLYLRVPAWLKWFPRSVLLQVVTAGIWLAGQLQQAGRVTVVVLAVFVGVLCWQLFIHGWILSGLGFAGAFFWLCYEWGRS